MKPEDWKKIENFTEAEVRATGADPKVVTLELMLATDKFRKVLGTPVLLVFNGMTTGKHKSPGHPDGRAVDCYTPRKTTADAAFKAAREAGFMAIGIYWNGVCYSYHLEVGGAQRYWIGRKPAPGSPVPWKMGPLINDPAVA